MCVFGFGECQQKLCSAKHCVPGRYLVWPSGWLQEVRKLLSRIIIYQSREFAIF